MTRYCYRHYGLTLDSNQALPQLAAAPSITADVTVEVLEPGARSETELPWVNTSPEAAISRADTLGGTWLRLRYWLNDDWAEFVVDPSGSSVTIARTSNVLLEEVTELLIGPVFSCLASQRGLTCVHAAVVRVSSRTIALAGGSGAGKSTTALALVQRGGVLVSDDVAVLSPAEGGIAAAAGAPRIRMRPDSAGLLTGSFDSLVPLWADGRPAPTKRYLRLDPEPRTRDEPHPLDAIYFLAPWTEQAREPSIVPLSPARTLTKLMAHRHMADAIHPDAHQRDFAILAQLAETVSASEVIRPAGLDTTDQTVAAVLDDVRNLA
ncbi:MAG TPA: hypothetical protein VFH80_01845 [Solirubrobacteraceae bacterium]|nr:hypothetical protein [Solirubrobacteraceae bacterium]